MIYEPSSPFWQIIGYWQTLIAGGLAVLAAAGTMWATISSANREISAAQQQTEAARTQIETTLQIERRRFAHEVWGLMVALHTAATQVIEDVGRARQKIPNDPARLPGQAKEIYYLRQRMRSSLFDELRPACIRTGGTIAPTFFDLDKELAVFAADWREGSVAGMLVNLGNVTTFHPQLDAIEKAAEHLRKEATGGINWCRSELTELESP